MEFSLTTFLLEMLNFLILVALLKHWFYKPVLDSIDRRRASIQSELDSADEVRRQAEELKQTYQSLMEQQEGERAAARQQLQTEMRAERERLRQELQQERSRSREAGKAELETLAAEYQSRAMEQGARFASRLLERLAGPQLQELLVDRALKELEELDPAVLEALKANGVVQVGSAYPLAQNYRKLLKGKLGKVEFGERPELLAGLSIEGGAHYLGANLKDELELFTRSGG